MNKEYFERAIKLVEELKEVYQSQAVRRSKIDYLLGFLEGGLEIAKLTKQRDGV